MSDISDPNMAFEPEEGAPEIDFQILEEGELPPEPAKPEPDPTKITMSKEEYEALVKKTDGTATLAQGLGQLAETLRTPAPIQQPVNMPQAEMSDEEFETELFTPGKGKALVQKLLQQQAAQIQGQNILLAMETNKKLLKLDPKTGPNFARYEKEIEQRVQSLPPQVRYRPDIYEAVYKEVLVDKQDEIIQERAAEIAKQAVEEALAAAGIKPQAPVPQPALRQAGQGGQAPAPKKTTVYLTRDQVEDMRARTMDPKDPDQVSAYYHKFVKGRK